MDAPLFLFLLWALVTWGAAAVSQKSFFFPALFHEGARNALFLWVNVAGIFFLSTQLNGLSGEKLTRLALAVAGISALYAVFQYAGWEPLWEQPVRPFGNRPVSTYGNPNFLSSALALFLPLALGESLRARNAFGSAAWGGLAIIYAGGLLATLTRSSWIGAGFGLVLFLWMERRVLQAQRRRAAWMAVAAMGILLVWSFVHEGRLSPLGRLLELWNGITGSEPYGSWHQRLLIWRSAWEMWAERPWIGRGWGLFELLFPFYQSRLLPFEIFRPFRTHANNAHQLFLEIGCQTGLIGLGIFLFAVVLATVIHGRRVSRLPDKSRSMLNACFAGLAAMSIDNVFGNVSLFFAVPAFLFFWTAGQWAAGSVVWEITLSPPRWARFAAPWFLGIIALAGIAREARSFVAQIY
jgi:O-antigen ligase